MGVRLTKKQCQFDEVQFESDLLWARNSKYVHADSREIFAYYKKELVSRRCVFIGLPCQCAALKTYLAACQADLSNIVFVELICHGTPSFKMLKDHIEYIQKKKSKEIGEFYFRENSEFFFVCKDIQGNTIYRKYLRSADEFWMGFSAGLCLRESCYNCKYACRQRIADITIGDFPGVGRDREYYGEKKCISGVLVNSDKGRELIENIDVYKIERDLEEILEDEGNPQLRNPMKKHLRCSLFTNLYRKTTFEKAVRRSLIKVYLRYYLFLPYRSGKIVLKKLLFGTKIGELIMRR